MSCKTDTGTLVWKRVGGSTKSYSSLTHSEPAQLGDHITVYPPSVSGLVITSVAMITRATLALNRTVIQCRDKESSEIAAHDQKTLLVLGKNNY